MRNYSIILTKCSGFLLCVVWNPFTSYTLLVLCVPLNLVLRVGVVGIVVLAEDNIDI